MGLGAIAASAGGKLLDGGINFASNRYFAKRQESFQDRMSSTAYQRATEDMRKAGLNPMLAYQQGGASSPSGASQSGVNPEMGEVVSTALQAKRLNADIKAIDESIQTQKTQQSLNKALENQAREQARLNSASAKQVGVNTEISNISIPGHKREAELQELHQILDRSQSGMFGNIFRYYKNKLFK